MKLQVSIKIISNQQKNLLKQICATDSFPTIFAVARNCIFQNRPQIGPNDHFQKTETRTLEQVVPAIGGCKKSLSTPATTRNVQQTIVVWQLPHFETDTWVDTN